MSPITIQVDQNIILRLPSGLYKLITINPKHHACSLGKFGTFDANLLVGHQYGLSYEIQEDKSLRILTVDNLKTLESLESNTIDEEDDIEDGENSVPVVSTAPVFKAVDEELANNEFIVDDKALNQALTYQEIRELRDNVHDRAELIDQLKKNNKSFALKTSFSQAKYTKRKMAKYIKRFTTIPATIFDVLEYLLDKDQDRVMNLNQETLAYMLNTADIRPGCEYLVVDEASGILISAILEKGGNVTVIHDTEHLNVDILKYLPQFCIDELTASGRLRGLSWQEAVESQDVLHELDQYEIRKAESKSTRDQEKLKKRRVLRNAIERHQTTKYDGLLVMSNHTASSILAYLLPYIKNSRKVVVYCPFREPLLTLRHQDLDGMLLMPNISEVRARAFQVLPGRTRPVMTKRGEYGYVFHALKVTRTEEVEAVGRHSHRRLEKEAHRLKAAKVDKTIVKSAMPHNIVLVETSPDDEASEQSAFHDNDLEAEKQFDTHVEEEAEEPPTKKIRIV